jgi:hypothetical protein
MAREVCGLEKYRYKRSIPTPLSKRRRSRTPKINVPTLKNTRAAGLEVQKGRKGELAPKRAQGLRHTLITR